MMCDKPTVKQEQFMWLDGKRQLFWVLKQQGLL
jgi:hypothetical protein